MNYEQSTPGAARALAEQRRSNYERARRAAAEALQALEERQRQRRDPEETAPP